MLRTKRFALLVAFTVCSLFVGTQIPAKDADWVHSFSFSDARSCALADVDGDMLQELIAVGSEGDVVALDIADNRVIWRQTLEHSPREIAIAVLKDDDSFDVLVTTDETLEWIDGSTGEPILSHPIPGGVRGIPSVYDLDGNGYDEVFVITDMDPRLLVLETTELGAMRTHRLGIPVPGNPGNGPSIGDINADGFPEVVIQSSQSGITVLSHTGDLLASWQGTSRINTSITLADVLEMAGGAEIVFANSNGQLVTLSWSEGDLIHSTTRIAAQQADLGNLAVAVQPMPVICTQTQANFRILDGFTREELLSSGNPRAPLTGFSLSPLDGSGMAAALIDIDGRLRVTRYTPNAELESDRISTHLVEEIGGVSQWTPLMADVDGDRDLDIIVLSKSTAGVTCQWWSTNLPCSEGQVDWITERGTFFNAGHINTVQRDHMLARMDAFHERVSRMAIQSQTALNNGNLEQARSIAQQVLKWDSNNAIAREVFEEVPDPEFQKQMKLYGIIGGLLLLLLVVGTLGYFARKRHQSALTSADAEGRWEDLLKLVEKPLRKGKATSHEKHLAGKAHARLEHYDEENLPLFRGLVATDPTSENKWALAKTLMKAGLETEESIDLFRDMTRSGNDEPELHLALGQALIKANEPARAITHFQVVLRQEPDNLGASILLCEAQINAGKLDVSYVEEACKLVRLGRAPQNIMDNLCEAAVRSAQTDRPEVFTAAEMSLSSGKGEAWAWLCKGLNALAVEDWASVVEAEKKLPASNGLEGFDLPLRAVAALENNDANAMDHLKRLVSGGHQLSHSVTLHIAQRLAQSGARDEMMRHFGERAMVLPTCPNEVLESLAECLAETGHPDEQVHVLAKLAEREPENPERRRAHAMLCASLRKTDSQAMQAYEQVLDTPPEETDDQRTLIFGCAAAGVRDPRITDMAETLLDDKPDDTELAILLVDQLLQQGAAPEAHMRGKEILERIPSDNLKAMETLGRAAFEAKDYEHARGIYKTLRDAEPDAPVWARSLSICLSRLGVHDEEAIALHRQVVAQNPQDAVMATILARALIERGQTEEGISVIRETLRSHSDLAPQMVRLLTRLVGSLPPNTADPVRLLLADLLSEQGEFAEAAQHLNELMDVTPEHSLPIAEKIERLAGARPDNFDAIMALALVNMRRGEYLRAMEEIERAKRMEPTNTDVLNLQVKCMRHITAAEDNAENRLRLGEYLLECEVPDEALSVLQPIQDDVFLFRPVRLLIARAYLMKNMMEMAWQELQTVPIDDTSKQMYYHLGEAAVQQGELSIAQGPWEKLYRADISYRDIRVRYEQLLEDINDDEKTNLMMEVPDAPTLSTAGEQLFRQRFDLEEEVGVGGMGRVYRARDKTLEETVALKILPPQLASNDQIVERLKREVRAARQLTHQNIIRIHDFGALGGQKFISMEFIEGPTLRHLIRTEPGLNPVQKITYATQMAEAMAHAHARGIIHRDIKPANILIKESEDAVKVTDFGIAKVVSGGIAEATTTSQVLGTPLYMSPEQVRGDQVDTRADIYSFGITFYEMLSGKPPFTEGDLAYQHLSRVPDPLTGVSDRLAKLVAACVEKQPENRPHSFEDIVALLKGMDENDTVPQ